MLGACLDRCFLQCREGLKADFTVLDRDMLQALQHGSALPEVIRTYVDGQCRFGCWEQQVSSNIAVKIAWGVYWWCFGFAQAFAVAVKQNQHLHMSVRLKQKLYATILKHFWAVVDFKKCRSFMQPSYSISKLLLISKGAHTQFSCSHAPSEHNSSETGA